MKKSTKLIVALLVVVAALAVTYRLMHRVPSADLEANAQMQQIITDAGCLRCHTQHRTYRSMQACLWPEKL